MRTIRLTDAQYALLSAFIDCAAGYDSVQDAIGEAADALPEVQEHEDEEARVDAAIAIQNDMWEAIANAAHD